MYIDKDNKIAPSIIVVDGMQIINPSASQYEAAGYVEYVAPEKTQAELLQEAISSKIRDIEAYDTSFNVNGFYIGSTLIWLDKDTRVGLMNSTNIEKASGAETTELWLGDINVTLNCDSVIQILSALELYAKKCYNVTAAHKNAVKELTSVEAIEAYDFTSGYPEKLTFNVLHQVMVK